MILQSMLQRLFASLMRGPGLNARPHNSRQRIDVMDLRHFGATQTERLVAQLLEQGSIDLPATVAAFKKPEYPESEWSDEQKTARQQSDRQTKLLGKLRDIAQDATDYYNDHGEQALFIGFPLLSVPVGTDRFSGKTSRILAPVLLAPVSLRVRRTTRPGITIELAAEGADRVMVNPALLAWIEQQTGNSSDELFTDEAGAEAWKEIAEALTYVAKAAGAECIPFTAETLLTAVPKSDDLPDRATLLPSAVLGLLPLANPGLLRDTRWMSENEGLLVQPASAFLKTAALAPAEEHALPEAEDYEPSSPNTRSIPDHATEWLVTHADPCQAGAVSHARSSETLVIHGPPGTGKSQTIANIVGDHLARGEKVLFVCDKRTALDVVKYRLDSMGLGGLCGVIHDPQHDRKDLYLSLRERLQELPQDAAIPDPRRDLELTNQRLSGLHGELRQHFDLLHASETGRSFHELTGEWYESQSAATTSLGIIEGLTPEMVHTHRTDADEVLRRSVSAQWTGNPLRDRVAMSLGDFFAKPHSAHHQDLLDAAELGQQADTALELATPVLSDTQPLDTEATALEQLADAVEKFLPSARLPWIRAVLDSPRPEELRTALTEISPHAATLETPLERELTLQTKGATPTLSACGNHLRALATWQEKAKSWTKLFAFGPKKEAAAALAPLGLAVTDEAVSRAQTFYSGIRARWLWADLLDRLTGVTSTTLPEDSPLRSLHQGLPLLLDLLTATGKVSSSAVREATLSWLRDSAESQGGHPLGETLRLGIARAKGLHRLESALKSTGLFRGETLVEWSSAWRAGQATAPTLSALVAASPTLEDVIRREDRMLTLPLPMQTALNQTAGAGLDWTAAEPAIRAAALAVEIRERLRQSPELARLDTDRIEAAFSELQERSQQKQTLVRQHVLHLWQGRWRKRLLATTGSRLNSEGAALRQRLFVRGQRAMKLRQMISAGATIEGGDPLFDLCPVWMASPATVAQIFPREALFDVIVFDEASQCRLEEALPVLLRGRRAVIAGDPKQLPPTRFFEQAVAESDDTSAETAEEVFEQQQSEAEDLLTAALNLDVQEAFLDVHYRSRNEALIGFSNDAFYSSRLQPIPGHPRNKAHQTPIRLIRAEGVYEDRANVIEARRAAELVGELLEEAEPPSIGVACFNITQRDAILDALEEKATADPAFAAKLELARKRRGRDSFEGLFVKNLENVQGDERDHLIICTTFGPDGQGKFRRNFGALSRSGGERRLNVLVTRARDAIHIITSVPRAEYLSPETFDDGRKPNGRHYLYDYLRYAERLAVIFENWQREIETAQRDADPLLLRGETANPSPMVEALGRTLLEKHRTGSTIYWGNDGFRVDLALTDPNLPEDVTIGALIDFTRYRKTPDPVVWELFRATVLRATGWELHRVWTPAIFRDATKCLTGLTTAHEKSTALSLAQRSHKATRARKAE